MSAATYDPNDVAADAFDMDNMVQGTTNKFITSAEKTVLDNTSGTNTGDQDLSSYVPNTRTVAGQALSSDVTIGATDLTATGISSTKFLRGDNTWVVPTNTTYTAMSVSEGETGTATTSRVVRADNLKQIIQFYVDDALATMNEDVTYGWQ